MKNVANLSHDPNRTNPTQKHTSLSTVALSIHMAKTGVKSKQKLDSMASLTIRSQLSVQPSA